MHTRGYGEIIQKRKRCAYGLQLNIGWEKCGVHVHASSHILKKKWWEKNQEDGEDGGGK